MFGKTTDHQMKMGLGLLVVLVLVLMFYSCPKDGFCDNAAKPYALLNGSNQRMSGIIDDRYGEAYTRGWIAEPYESTIPAVVRTAVPLVGENVNPIVTTSSMRSHRDAMQHELYGEDEEYAGTSVSYMSHERPPTFNRQDPNSILMLNKGQGADGVPQSAVERAEFMLDHSLLGSNIDLFEKNPLTNKQTSIEVMDNPYEYTTRQYPAHITNPTIDFMSRPYPAHITNPTIDFMSRPPQFFGGRQNSFEAKLTNAERSAWGDSRASRNAYGSDEVESDGVGMDYGAYIADTMIDPRTRANHAKWSEEMQPWAATAKIVDRLNVEDYVDFVGLRRPQPVAQYNPRQLTEIDASDLANNAEFHFNGRAPVTRDLNCVIP
jgi:hypothetical protein